MLARGEGAMNKITLAVALWTSTAWALPTKLSWETKVETSYYWTGITMAAVQKHWQTLDGAQDMDLFCPQYRTLSLEERQTVWGELFSALAYYESGWNPKSQYTEITLGIDQVTGKPLTSEGLLQLSYTDTRWATWCEFDWERDKKVATYDLTILNPKNNLECGIGIMANQIRKHKNITLNKGVYWSTLKLEGSRTKIKEIGQMVQTRVPQCQKHKSL
jgi:hypothetical protein